MESAPPFRTPFLYISYQQRTRHGSVSATLLITRMKYSKKPSGPSLPKLCGMRSLIISALKRRRSSGEKKSARTYEKLSLLDSVGSSSRRFCGESDDNGDTRNHHPRRPPFGAYRGCLH